MNEKMCRRCLLSEADAVLYAESVSEYISLIPAENKCIGEKYEERLGICLSCVALGSGMCGECGCFIEIRAAKANMHCPVGRW